MNKTPISILQEVLVKQQNMLPRYTEITSDKEGYNFACLVQAGNFKATGYGSNKKEAKQNSAYEALLLLNVPIDNAYEPTSIGNVYTPIAVKSNSLNVNGNPVTENYIGKLNEYASMNGKQYPQYIDKNIIALHGRFIVQCQFLNLSTEGHGSNKKIAKQESAKKMFDILKDKNYESNIGELSSTLSTLGEDKKENINKLSEAMVKKYEEMSINEGGIKQSSVFPPMSYLEEDVNSLEQLQEELRKIGHKAVVEIFQRNPFIAMLKIKDTHCVIMGHGETEVEARSDLLKVASLMLRNGFSIKNEL